LYKKVTMLLVTNEMLYLQTLSMKDCRIFLSSTTSLGIVFYLFTIRIHWRKRMTILGIAKVWCGNTGNVKF
jgi:hypothetical protein